MAPGNQSSMHSSHSGSFKPPGSSGRSGSFKTPPPAKPAPPASKTPPEDEPIALVDEPIAVEGGAGGKPDQAPTIRPTGAPPASAVRAIKSTLDLAKRTEFKREPVNTGTGAVRCRAFHCKIAESSIEHMENQINAWLDDENIDVKHVGHIVGAMEGKHTEPNIIVMVWY